MMIFMISTMRISLKSLLSDSKRNGGKKSRDLGKEDVL